MNEFSEELTSALAAMRMTVEQHDLRTAAGAMPHEIAALRGDVLRTARVVLRTLADDARKAEATRLGGRSW